jgi:hypothetical protein
MKSVKGSLAFLISFSLLALVVPFSAQADGANQPQINYSDNTGLSFAVAPISISGLKPLLRHLLSRRIKVFKLRQPQLVLRLHQL